MRTFSRGLMFCLSGALAVNITFQHVGEVLVGGSGPFPGDVLHAHQHDSHHSSNDVHFNVTRDVLATRAARWLKPDASFYGQVPAVAGTASPDLSYFQSPAVLAALGASMNQTRDDWGDDWDLEVCFVSTQWPPYMVANETLPVNLTAAASMHVALLFAMEAASGVLPTRVEVINEPDTERITSPWGTIVEFHKAVFDAVKTAFGGRIEVGGPTLSDTQFAHGSGMVPFYSLQTKVGDVLKAVPLDFVSFHRFDAMKDGVVHRGGSGHDVAVLDAVQAYTQAVVGRQVPIFVTEHGFASDSGPQVDADYMHQLTSFFSQWLAFQARADGLIASSAFHIDNGFAWHTNPSVSIVNYTTGLPTSTGHVFTALRRLANATRVMVDVNPPSPVMAGGFVTAANMTIMLVNLAMAPTAVHTTVDGLPQAAYVERMYGNSKLGLVHALHSFPVASLATLTLNPSEVFVLTAPVSSWLTASWHRTIAYSADVLLSSPPSGDAATVVAVEPGAAVQQAVLRVAFGRSVYGTVPPLVAPKATVNGVEVVVEELYFDGTPPNTTGHSVRLSPLLPVPLCFTRPLTQEWRTWQGPIPAGAVVAGNNTVTLSNGVKGAWSSVAILVWR